jgi:hypothetical protein
MGDDGMAAAGMGGAGEHLQALTKLITTTADPHLLDELARDLSRFDGHLPDGRLGLRRMRLWLENAISSDELADGGERFRGVAGVPFRTWVAWRLWHEDVLLNDFRNLTTIATRGDGVTLVDTLKRDADHSHDEIVRTVDLHREALIAISAFDLVSIYRAAQIAIRLQEWHIEHGVYPADASVFGLPLDVYSLRYEVAGHGHGYKLIGPRTTLVDRRPES